MRIRRLHFICLNSFSELNSKFQQHLPHHETRASFCSQQTNYKKKFVKEKGKSNYSVMLEPPEVKHAMEVAKKQSTVSFVFL